MGLFDGINSFFGATAEGAPVQGYDQRHNMYVDAYNQAQAASDPLAQNQYRQNQSDLIAQLQAQAAGGGPSLTGQMLQNAQNQQAAQTNALMNSARGNINPALLYRNAMNANQNNAQNIAQQAATGRVQEQMNAQNQLANTLSQARGQDLQNTQLQYGQMGSMLSGDQSQAMGQAQIQSAANLQNAQNNSKMMGGLFGGAASALTSFLAHGGLVRAALSPGEKVISPDGTMTTVPGNAQFPGDDYRNDNVVADLRENSIVVPRSHAGNNEKVIEFLSHMKSSDKKKSSLEDILSSHQELKEKLAEISEKLGKLK
jgi:hypothetical protein